MAEVTILPSQVGMDEHRDTAGAELYPNSAPSNVSAPAPNPSFSFPSLPPADSVADEDLPETQTGRHRAGSHRSRPSNIAISPMPPFSFGSPGVAPSPGKTPPSLGAEPSPTRSMPLRNAGHRRGGSEFIGGDGSAIGPGLMSASPTKGEDILPSPPTSGRRRGHAHRRSGAISNHDLSSLLKPNNDSAAFRTGSAPNSPADPNSHRRFMPSLDHSASQPTLRSQDSIEQRFEETPASSPPASPKRSPLGNSNKSSPGTGQPRPRVGFSDTLEFIPRPLSTISSETSSSLSTIRAPHSLTGSITSVISNNTSSPPSAKKQQITADTLREYREEPRPRTAESPTTFEPLGAPFQPDVFQSNRPSSAGAGMILKMRNPAPETGNDFDISQGTMIDANYPPSPPSPQLNADLRRLRGIPSNPSSDQSRPRSSPEAKVTKKHRKVKTWAGSLLSRKSKTKSSESLEKNGESKDDQSNTDKTATLQEFAPMEDFSLEDVDFDEDTTCVIRSPDYEPPTSARSASAAIPTTYPSRDTQPPTGVLDLDATWRALDEEESKSSSKRRTMHSGGNTAGFAGSGMHYHRRAESAPALTPVSQASGIRRRGSQSQMADVFEEEEEEEGVSKKSNEKRGYSSGHVNRPSEEERALLGLGVTVVDLDRSSLESPTTRSAKRRQLARSVSDEPPRVQKDIGGSLKTSKSEESYSMSDLPVEVVEAAEEPRFSIVTKSSDESTITPTFPDSIHNPAREDLPMAQDFAEPRFRHLETHSTTSSTASPDTHHLSFEGSRLHTAASSITDRSGWSAVRPNESAHAVTYSTEDVPSLTSSASTMISGHPQLSPSFPPRASAERSYSFSAAVPRRTRPVSAGKRASLASLSRLVSTSYGEKSKLSVASFPDNEEKPEKKKRNRISRLMKGFWKSKEKLNASDEARVDSSR